MKGISYTCGNYPLFPVQHEFWPSLDEKTRRQVIDQVARLLLKTVEVEKSSDPPQSLQENEHE